MKGNISMDLIIIIIFATVISVVGFVGAYMFNATFESIATVPGVNTTLLDNAQSGIDAMVYMFPVIFIGMFLGLIILNYSVNSHPVFAIFSFLFLLVMTVIAAGMSNLFEVFAASDGISSMATRYPLVVGFMSQLPIITFLLGGIAIIVLYGKKRGGDEI